MPATAINPVTVTEHNQLADRILTLIDELFSYYQEFQYYVKSLETTPLAQSLTLVQSLIDQLERLQDCVRAIADTLAKLDEFYNVHPDIVPTFGPENVEREGLNDIIVVIIEKLPHATLLGNLNTLFDHLASIVSMNIETLIDMPIRLT